MFVFLFPLWLEGADPAVAWPIFLVKDHANTNYVRNTDCWAYPYDLSGVAVWNNANHPTDGYPMPNDFAGTLISPQHVLFANHWDYIPDGGKMRFVDMNNQIEERILMQKLEHPTLDFSVGLLSSPLPTNRFKFYKILPNDYADYIHTGKGLPVLALNKSKRAYIHEINEISSTVVCRLPVVSTNRAAYAVFKHPPPDEDKAGLIGGDSGNPAFLFLGGEPVLLTVWEKGNGGSGAFVTAFKQDINDMMNQLGGGYQLTEFDLTVYKKLKREAK